MESRLQMGIINKKSPNPGHISHSFPVDRYEYFKKVSGLDEVRSNVTNRYTSVLIALNAPIEFQGTFAARFVRQYHGRRVEQ
ncbi:hypothetical protein M378DRAFT_170890 [Amanita muscaria Koide BX008]|uniref:Uncharacterized protein n=1 Tax=Amanita muscaria (strain Koide BX008) TaxID=946122 RepID=A0A0C2WN78_AMAMK|nr:hypothetical protein M378DRAFT_170890 [Amanita muscaria Koide BX008]